MARCADGLAFGGDATVAVNAAIDRALTGMAGRSPDLVTVFVSGADPGDTEAALLAASTRLAPATVVGCGAEGVVSGEREMSGSTAVSVWMASLPHARIRSFHLEVIRTETSLAVVGMPPRREDDACAVLLADPWSFPAEGFVDSSGAALDDLPIVGGLVGAFSSGRARMLVDGRVVDRGAIGVCLGGDVAVHLAVAHASRPVGPPMTVTAAEGEAVLSLAGRPAIDRIEAVVADLSDQDQALASGALLIGAVFDEYADEHGIGDFAVQSVVASDPDTKALYVAEPLSVGTTVRLHVVDPVAARADLDAAVAGLATRTEIVGALVFAGVPRGAAVGDPEGDLISLQHATAARGIAGLLTLGGIGPVAGDNRLLGFASAVLVIGQAVPDRVLAG
jgi:small ligand-binding sensory domain FIST